MTGNSELAADGIAYNGYLLYLVYETLQDQSNNYYVNEYWYNFKSTGVTEEDSYVYYDTSNANATAADILSGKTAFNSSGSVSGSIPTKTSSDLTANNLTVTVPSGYYASAASKTLTDANLVAGNIKKDVTIFGVTGTYEGGGGSLVITDVSNTSGTTAEISVSGGGSSAQTETGTFSGGGGNVETISCSFAPDLVYIHGDLSSSASLRGIVTLTIIKDTYILVTCDSSTSQTYENLMYGAYGITGYSTDTSNPYATYSDGTLTINTVTNSGSARWASGISYSYKLVKWS